MQEISKQISIQPIDNEHSNLLFNDKILVEHTANPHDSMAFFVIVNLPDDLRDYDQFAQELFTKIRQEFGGKTCVEIAGHITGKDRENLHASLARAGFVNENLNANIIAINRCELEKRILQIGEKNAVKKQYASFNNKACSLETDSQELLKHHKKFLQLLETSGYFTSLKVRQGLYSELGLKKRIEHRDALPAGIFHQDSLIGCAFIFIYGNKQSAYIHDVTIIEQYRNNGLGQAFFIKLYEYTIQKFPQLQNLWLIGGGSADSAKIREHIYKDIFGGRSFGELVNDSKQGIYINFMPEGPKLLNSAQRQNEKITITYTDNHQVEFFPAKLNTLSLDDQTRIELLEKQELIQRSTNKQTLNTQIEKNLPASSNAFYLSKLSINPSLPTRKSESKEIKKSTASTENRNIPSYT